VKGPEPNLLVLPHLDRWASQWDGLVDASPLPSPFLRSWWLIGAGGPRPRFLLVVEDGRLLGGLALEEGRRLGLPCLRMMGAGPLCPDHLDLLATPGQQDAVVRAVREWLRRPGARLMSLEGIHAGSRLIAAVPGHVRREPLAVAPWAPLPADAGTYLAARPAGFRKTLRRASARMTAAGTTHRINRGRSAVRSLSSLRQLHQAQWGDRSRFLPAFDRFAAACHLAAGFDEVSVHELAVGETVIAIMVTFEVAGRVSLYQSARLTDFRWRDATTVLLAAIITDACNRGFAEVDFLRGDEAYKNNFAPERRELLRLRGANSMTGQGALVAESGARKARLVARSAQESWRGRRGRPKTTAIRPAAVHQAAQSFR
jgi:CelD/BcsL family acetyltransferase involved in cellulose biosynthesis